MKSGGILIVEDEGILAMGIGEMLERAGYRVAGIASTAEQAVAEAKRRHPDLVLMDIRLKGEGDGIEAAKEIRATCPAPVVFLTAYADDETIARVKEADPYGYIIKPFDERHLLVTIELALTKHQAEKRAFEALEQVRQSNALLERQRHFLTALFEAIPCAVVVVGPDRRIRAASPFLLTMFDTTEEAVLGKAPGDALGCSSSLHGPDSCETMRCERTCTVGRAVTAALEGSRLHRVKADLQVASEGAVRERRLLVSASPLIFGDERSCVLILEDVTELFLLRQMFDRREEFAGIVGRHPRMKELFSVIVEVAQSLVPVLIRGEVGTGKERAALAIHTEGPRSARPFVSLSCSALPDGLFESELFGHVKGAFTGALRDKRGRLEMAHGGTLFLDDVDQLSPHMQAKMLKVLQTGTVEHVGGDQPIPVDVRLICATSKNLKDEVGAGRFRGDLYYRLCVVPIQLPALRERREDIPLLTERILARIASERGSKSATVSSTALGLLMDYAWPGNLRELENALQFAILKSKGQTIQPEHLPAFLHPKNGLEAVRGRRARKLKADTVKAALLSTRGNKLRAAKELGVSRATLYRFLGEKEPPPPLDAAIGVPPASPPADA